MLKDKIIYVSKIRTIAFWIMIVSIPIAMLLSEIRIYIPSEDYYTMYDNDFGYDEAVVTALWSTFVYVILSTRRFIVYTSVGIKNMFEEIKEK